MSQARRFVPLVAIVVGVFATSTASALARVHARHHQHHRSVGIVHHGCPARARKHRRRHAWARCVEKSAHSSASPATSSPPAISGLTVEGQTLSASTGSWTGSTPMRYAYQWQRNGNNVSGASGSKYVLSSSDVGYRMDVIVTAANRVGSSSATSATTPTVTAAQSSEPETPLAPPPPVPPPAPIPSPYTTVHRGVNSHAAWYWQVSDADVKHELDEAAALGVDFIRVPVEWGGIEWGGEGVRGGEALTRLDLIVNEAAARGIKVDGVIAGTPHWAAPGGAWSDAPAAPQKSLRGFTKWLTERYCTKLLALSAWNEPTKEENLEAPTGEYLSNTTEEGLARRAYYYVQIVKAVYNGAREGNAAIKVLAHEDGDEVNQTVKPLVFLKACFEGGLPHGKEEAQSGFKGYYDAIAIHAYAEGGPAESANENSTKSKIERLHTFLEEHEGASPVSIWNNEWGYSLEDPELVRAEYVEKGVRMLDTQFPYLEGWAYYQLRDTVNSATNKEDNFGLLLPNFLPRLTFAAFEAGMA